MEHSDRGKYVTHVVREWIDNDEVSISGARAAARRDRLEEFLRSKIKYALPNEPAHHVRQELAANDMGRVDWAGIAESLTEE